MNLSEQELEKRTGFYFTLLRTQELFASDMHVDEHLRDSLFILAHLSGYIDCNGKWLGKKPDGADEYEHQFPE